MAGWCPATAAQEEMRRPVARIRHDEREVDRPDQRVVDRLEMAARVNPLGVAAHVLRVERVAGPQRRQGFEAADAAGGAGTGTITPGASEISSCTRTPVT